MFRRPKRRFAKKRPPSKMLGRSALAVAAIAAAYLVLPESFLFRPDSPKIGLAESESPAIGWTVEAVAGSVRARHGVAEWQPLATGQALDGDEQIEAGPNGAATLVRGRSLVQIQPNTRLRIAPSASADELNRIAHEAGSLFFTLAASAGEIEVETPHMVAVANGTSFTVSVSDSGAAISVTQGTLSVAQPGPGPNGRAVEVGVGQTASASVGHAGIVTFPTAGPGKALVPTPDPTSSPGKAGVGRKGGPVNAAVGSSEQGNSETGHGGTGAGSTDNMPALVHDS